ARTHLWSSDVLPEFRLGLENLRAHKLRSLLTMLGMIFGVGAVIAMLSIGAGGEKKALEAIGKLGADGKPASGEVSDLVADADPATRKLAGQVLVQINPDAALSDKSPAVRIKVARALTAINPNAPVRTLADLLGGSDAAMRRDAAEALATVGTAARDAVPALGKALKDKDPAVRKSAAVALGNVGEASRPALADIIAALADRKLHQPLLVALKNVGWVKGVPPLVEALKDNDAAVRLGAAQALAQFGDDATDGAAKPLKAAAAVEKDEEVRKAMREALKRISPE
ncbi:MAG TPA: HEAT repeat domain-containing protein, partial [Gemmataceae bacterium]|nr:HEAT repeat domain-containing protein [Gemmataceae bacterium]